MQMLAALESTMQKEHTKGRGTISAALYHSVPRILLPIPPSKAWPFLRHKQKALAQEEEENTSEPGGMFMYACTYMVAFRTI